MRLQRVGRKNVKTFRIVVTESKNSTKSGKFLETIGMYDPEHDKKEIDVARAKYWISKGVQPTDTLHNFLLDRKIIEGKKVNALPKHRPIKKEEKSQKGAGEKKDETIAATIVAPATEAATAPAPVSVAPAEVKT